uniref:Hermansky-Pudlak syndrome 3 protein n=1 Tax=Denticeps clupeoides TaxID=299321 RepID=A0AAY4BEM2_9TELE
MVHVYNSHPFASQQIVPTEQEPGLVCCGGDALFAVSAGGCKIEAYQLREEGCPLICRFATMDLKNVFLLFLLYFFSQGDYLVTIEEKNQATYLRAYTNWRYQAAEKTRIGVRLLGHFLRSASTLRGDPKEQMEIIEIPLFELPQCMACCPLTGDLLVGCSKNLVLFSLRQQTLSEHLSVLDFERFLILHVPSWTPSQVALCAGYVALQAELEVLVVKLEHLQPNQEPQEGQGHALIPEDMVTQKQRWEMLGEQAKACGVSVSLEWTGLESETRKDMGVTYVLYRRFAPDFFQGCSVEDTCLHSLQLYPMFTSQQEGGKEEPTEPACVFCFFSLPNIGYMYSLKNAVELISAYQYPEKALQAVLTAHFLHVITKTTLQCFSVRCSAVAARVEDPYIDTTMKACPPYAMEVCALRIQLFIGLKALCQNRNHIVLLTAADVESKEETERPVRRSLSRKASFVKPKEPSEKSHGWNLYVVNTMPTLTLYGEMVEYSKKYALSDPFSLSCVHLLSEAHLLLRASLLDPDLDPTERSLIQQAFRESCAQLGDCFSRLDKRDCHLALPYYKMSGLSVTEVIERNKPATDSALEYGKGFIFFLKHSLYEESMEELSEVSASKYSLFFFFPLHAKRQPSLRPDTPGTAGGLQRSLRNPHPDQGGPGKKMVNLSKMAVWLSVVLGYSYHIILLSSSSQMLQVYGFIEEPKLLLQGRGKDVVPTALAWYLRDTQDGLLVAATVALHENNKVKLDEADLFFQELCKDGREPKGCPQLLVDFWESLLVASSQDTVIQELLFRLTSVYIDRITHQDHLGMKSLKTAEDLINSCSHYGVLYPWLSILTPVQFNITQDHQEDLQKLQSLLCGPTLDVSSILPLLEQLSDADDAGLSVHVLCATKLGHHESSIEQLLDRCPQAIIPFANHELQNDKMPLWWQKLFPELCKRTRAAEGENTVLLSALKETLVVVAMELNPLEFLDLLPDDGTAHFFLPHLLECSQRNLMI